MNEKINRLESLKKSVREACLASNRQEEEVTLIAVSKTKPWEDVRDFLQMGVCNFGENYVQEALAKIDSISQWQANNPESSARKPIQWHFIGTLQSNKAKLVVGKFVLFHALDSLSLGEKIEKAAAAKNLTQDCLIEVNVDGEATKGGIAPDSLLPFLEKANSWPHVNIRGLTCIPAPIQRRDPRLPFSTLRNLLEKANSAGAYRNKLSELSMGMSADYPAAILEGSTMIRVGTTLFGARAK